MSQDIGQVLAYSAPLLPSPLVGEGAFAERRRVRGQPLVLPLPLTRRERALRFRATLSHKGRGEESGSAFGVVMR
jgi:hypothetical protein